MMTLLIELLERGRTRQPKMSGVSLPKISSKNIQQQLNL
jgi:hypothetical protein